MPKKQTSAAKRARAAVRAGAAKYTTALREESAGRHLAVPGPGPDGQVPPCPDLPYEVLVFADPGYDKGEIYGRDYGGSAPAWWTSAWTRSADRAAEVARAVVAWNRGDRVATVWGRPRTAAAASSCAWRPGPRRAPPVPARSSARHRPVYGPPPPRRSPGRSSALASPSVRLPGTACGCGPRSGHGRKSRGSTPAQVPA
ncbi:hypothetical protein [Streptosporangium sp. NPDC023615]|uniref:hypothetical protein n=1 Tax=Streptosporangium sp. NPDC023615 TaxID=3154794 RepID=UPI00342D67EA